MSCCYAVKVLLLNCVLTALLFVLGAESWPPGVCLKYIGGDQFGHVNTVMVKSLDPQEISDVSVQMRSPTTPGMYQGQWRMCTATGLFYGGRKFIMKQFIRAATNFGFHYVVIC